jgi:hypothetical protein
MERVFIASFDLDAEDTWVECDRLHHSDGIWEVQFLMECVLIASSDLDAEDT